MNQKLNTDCEDVKTLLYEIKAPRSRINESGSPLHSGILGRNGMKVGGFNMLHYFENLNTS